MAKNYAMKLVVVSNIKPVREIWPIPDPAIIVLNGMALIIGPMTARENVYAGEMIAYFITYF